MQTASEIAHFLRLLRRLKLGDQVWICDRRTVDGCAVRRRSFKLRQKIRIRNGCANRHLSRHRHIGHDRRRLRCLGRHAVQDTWNVFLGFGKRRDAAVLLDVTGSGIICRKRQIDIPEFIKVLFQVARRTVRRLVRIHRIDAKLLRRVRHDLEKTARANRTDSVRASAAFLHHHCVQDPRRQAVLGFNRCPVVCRRLRLWLVYAALKSLQQQRICYCLHCSNHCPFTLT